MRLNYKLTSLNLSNGVIAQRDTTALRMPGHWIFKLIVSANEKILNINIVALNLLSRRLAHFRLSSVAQKFSIGSQTGRHLWKPCRRSTFVFGSSKHFNSYFYETKDRICCIRILMVAILSTKWRLTRRQLFSGISLNRMLVPVQMWECEQGRRNTQHLGVLFIVDLYKC